MRSNGYFYLVIFQDYTFESAIFFAPCLVCEAVTDPIITLRVDVDMKKCLSRRDSSRLRFVYENPSGIFVGKFKLAINYV
jgi:hypothetical protein